MMIHSEFIQFKGEDINSFPSERENNNFVGEVFIEKQNILNRHKEDLKKAKLTVLPSPIFYSSFYLRVLKCYLRNIKKID